jgi:hypothetical protein
LKNPWLIQLWVIFHKYVHTFLFFFIFDKYV